MKRELTEDQKKLFENYPQVLETVGRVLRSTYAPKADSIEAVHYAMSIAEYIREDNLKELSKMLWNLSSFILDLQGLVDLYKSMQKGSPKRFAQEVAKYKKKGIEI